MTERDRSRGPAPPDRAAARENPPGTKRILIVDDSPIILEAARLALHAVGFEVETRSGVEDLGSRGSSGFDLILMDVQMPELYGDDVAAVLRHQRAVTTPIYLLSTLPEEELRQRSAEAGVDGYISKSGGLEHVVSRVKDILGTA
jgi:DNA-binding response OmpR family regulator